MSKRYFGNFQVVDDVNKEFAITGSTRVKDTEILFAFYGTAPYEGDAIVIFERTGKLFEVNASHCSCYGLEDQWAPEETSWEALKIRKFYTCDDDQKPLESLRALIDAHIPKETS